MIAKNIHILYKFFWLLRAFAMKFLFRNVGTLTYIGKPSFLYNPQGASIGKRVRLFPGLRLECHGQGKIEIGDNVVVGNNLHITCANSLIIGKGTLITSNVMITDIDHLYQDVSLSVIDQGVFSQNTVIGQNCFIGHGAVIQAGTILGDHCIVGANSVVRGNFPSYSVIVGAPAKVIKLYNENEKLWERK